MSTISEATTTDRTKRHLLSQDRQTNAIVVMSNAFIEKFNSECSAYLKSELNARLLSSSVTDKSTASEYYLAEYQRCTNEQMNVAHYMTEQNASLDALRSCEAAIETFLGRLKAIHEYETKQNELFEQILHELTTMNPSSKEDRFRLLEQIDDLIVAKTKLTGHIGDSNPTKLTAKSSDTFKTIL